MTTTEEGEIQTHRAAFFVQLIHIEKLLGWEGSLYQLAEKLVTEEAMSRSHGRQYLAARTTGVSRRVIHYQVHKWGVAYLVGFIKMKWGTAAR